MYIRACVSKHAFVCMRLELMHTVIYYAFTSLSEGSLSVVVDSVDRVSVRWRGRVFAVLTVPHRGSGSTHPDIALLLAQPLGKQAAVPAPLLLQASSRSLHRVGHWSLTTWITPRRLIAWTGESKVRVTVILGRLLGWGK